MDLSIVIVNWNTRDMLRDCLASIPPDGEGMLLARVRMEPQRFAREFRATIATRRVARSAGGGWTDQRCLERCEVPGRYRALVAELAQGSR